MNHYIAQTQAPTVPPPPSSAVLDWGIAGALIIYLGKEAIAFFKKKDESESRLTDTLIQDLRGEGQLLLKQNNSLLLEMKTHQTNSIHYLKKLRDELAEINLLIQSLKRDTGGLYLESRGGRDLLIILESKIDALHNRLDFEGKTIAKGLLSPSKSDQE